MLHSLLFLLALSATSIAQPSRATLFEQPALALWQDDEDQVKEDDRADLALRLKEFDALVKAHHKAREPEPGPVIALLDGLLGDFGDLGPKDRARLVKSVGAVLNLKRIKNNPEGKPELRLCLAALVALGEMGPEGAKPLLSALGKKPFKKHAALQLTLIESLGVLRHPDSLKALIGLLSHDNPEVLAASARALGRFDELEDKARKDLFKRLLKLLVSNRKLLDKNPDDPDTYARWGVVSGALQKSLESLSGHAESEVQAWEEWWDENRKRDWSE